MICTLITILNMAFVLDCKITIGNTAFTSVHDVVIKHSIHSLVQTAEIRIPLSARLHNASGAEPVETHKVFNPGDPVTIELGYNGNLKPEFSGYVKRLSYGMPMIIECEDHAYIVRKNHLTHAAENMTLKEVIDLCLKGLYKTDGEVPGLVIDQFNVKNESALNVLQGIANSYGLGIFFTPQGKLYVGPLYGYRAGDVQYNTHLNVDPSRNELYWQHVDDVRLKIIANSWRKDGSLISEAIGDDDGQVRTLWFYNIEDAAVLRRRAQDEVAMYKFTGYRGYFQTLLEPYAAPGMTAIITDPDFPERGGSYYIESVETRFGVSGATRRIEPGIKLD